MSQAKKRIPQKEKITVVEKKRERNHRKEKRLIKSYVWSTALYRNET